MAPPATFDTVGGEFLDYGKTVRGYVRYEVTRYHLAEHLGDQPLNILDLGGGDGRDAIWAAERGHNVAVVDPSGEMLSRAQESLAEVAPHVRNRVSLMVGDEETAIDGFGPGAFDAALSHGVLMYQIDRPQAHLDRTVDLVKSGGLVSLLTRGYQSSQERLIKAGDLTGIQKLYYNRRFVNNLGVVTLAYRPEEIEAMLEMAGAELIDWYGVRVSRDGDGRGIHYLSADELRNIVREEITLSEREGSRPRGQMLHYLARKQ